MAWTDADLVEIEKAIASGVKKVRFQTHEAEYQTTREMIMVRDLIKAELDPRQRPGVMLAEFHGGH